MFRDLVDDDDELCKSGEGDRYGKIEEILKWLKGETYETQLRSMSFFFVVVIFLPVQVC